MQDISQTKSFVFISYQILTGQIINKPSQIPQNDLILAQSKFQKIKILRNAKSIIQKFKQLKQIHFQIVIYSQKQNKLLFGFLGVMKIYAKNINLLMPDIGVIKTNQQQLINKLKISQQIKINLSIRANTIQRKYYINKNQCYMLNSYNKCDTESNIKQISCKNINLAEKLSEIYNQTYLKIRFNFQKYLPGNQNSFLFINYKLLQKFICQQKKKQNQFQTIFKIFLHFVQHRYLVFIYGKQNIKQQLQQLNTVFKTLYSKTLQYPYLRGLIQLNKSQQKKQNIENQIYQRNSPKCIQIFKFEQQLLSYQIIKNIFIKKFNITDQRNSYIFDDQKSQLVEIKSFNYTFIKIERINNDIIQKLQQILHQIQDKIIKDLIQERSINQIQSSISISHQQNHMLQILSSKKQLPNTAIQQIKISEDQFIFTGEKRSGGSVFSCGKFIHSKTASLFYAKSDLIFKKQFTIQQIDINKMCAQIIKQKICYDIYQFYGARIPKIYLKKVKMVNPNVNINIDYDMQQTLDQFPQVVHLMSQLVKGYCDYRYSDDFPSKQSKQQTRDFSLFRTRKIKYKNKQYKQKGLGKILAIAHFLGDTDVIGGSGGNIGFVILDQQRCQSINIDPGEAFRNLQNSIKQIRDLQNKQKTNQNRLNKFQKNKLRQIMLGSGGIEPIKFQQLNYQIQRQFLLTLMIIKKRTSLGVIQGFFRRKGAQQFLLYHDLQLGSLAVNALTWFNLIYQAFQQDIQNLGDLLSKNNIILKQNSNQRNTLAKLSQIKLFVSPIVLVKNKKKQYLFIEYLVSFLSSNKKVLLIYGDAGQGKSLCILWYYYCQLLRKGIDFKNKFKLFQLKSFNSQTIKTGFNQINQQTQYVFLDGYDQIQRNQKLNIYKINHFQKFPKIKLVITCRTQFLQQGYPAWFVPTQGISYYEQIQIQPFNYYQIKEYIHKYIEDKKGERQHILKLLENTQIIQLLKNPLMLRIVCHVARQIKELQIINRYSIYQIFMNDWFVSQYSKYKAENIKGVHYKKYKKYSQQLAIKMIKQNCVQIDYKTLKQLVKSKESLIKGIPLQFKRGKCSFIHKSFLQFNAAKYILQKIRQKKYNQQPQLIVKCQAVVQFIREHFQCYKMDYYIMLSIIRQSKINKKISKSAAAAITAVNLYNPLFSGMDFSNISIPGADITSAYLQNVNFQNANLSKVIFDKCYCLRTNFKNSDLRGAKFGILPDIYFNQRINAIDLKIKDQNIFIAVGGSNGTIGIYDESKKVLFNQKFESSVKCIKWANHSTILISGNKNKTIYILQFDIDFKKIDIKILKGHSCEINTICFSKDDSYIISGGSDKTIKIWSIQTQQNIKTIKQDSQVNTVCSSQYQNYFFIGNSAGIIKIFDILTFSQIKVLSGHFSEINVIAISKNQKKIASGSNDNIIIIWNIKIQKIVAKLKGHSYPITSIVFTEDQQKIISSSRDKTIKIWNIATGQPIKIFQGHSSAITSIFYYQKSNRIYSGSWDQTIKIWEIQTGNQISKISRHKDIVSTICYTRDGKKIISGSFDHNIKIWNAETGRLIKTLKSHTNRINSISLSNDQLNIISGSRDRTIKIWNISTLSNVQTLIGHTNVISSVCYSLDDKRIFSGSYDKTIKVWDGRTGLLIKNLKGHTQQIIQVKCTFQINKIVSCSLDNSIRIWDVQTNQMKVLLKAKRDYNSICISQDGKKLGILNSFDNYLQIYNLEKCELQLKLDVKFRNLYSLRFSKNNNQIATFGFKKCLTTWDLEKGIEKKQFQHIGLGVMCLCYSSDKKIIIGNSDKSIKILNNQQNIKKSSIEWLCFSKDYSKMLVTFQSSQVQIYDIKTLQRIQYVKNEIQWNKIILFNEVQQCKLMMSIPQGQLSLVQIKFDGIKYDNKYIEQLFRNSQK